MANRARIQSEARAPFFLAGLHLRASSKQHGQWSGSGLIHVDRKLLIPIFASCLPINASAYVLPSFPQLLTQKLELWLFSLSPYYL